MLSWMPPGGGVLAEVCHPHIPMGFLAGRGRVSVGTMMNSSLQVSIEKEGERDGESEGERKSYSNFKACQRGRL